MFEKNLNWRPKICALVKFLFLLFYLLAFIEKQLPEMVWFLESNQHSLEYWSSTCLPCDFAQVAWLSLSSTRK